MVRVCVRVQVRNCGWVFVRAWVRLRVNPLNITISRSRSLSHRVGARMHCPQYGRSTVAFIQVPLAPIEPGPAIGNFSFFFPLGWRSSPGKHRVVIEHERVHFVLRRWLQRTCKISLADPAINHMLVSLPNSGTFLKFLT